MSNECIDYSTMLATWGATLGTWAAVAVASVAGYFAWRAYQAQEKQVELLQAQRDEDRAAARQENQLKRFRHGPFLRLAQIEGRSGGANSKTVTLWLRDDKSCQLDRIVARVNKTDYEMKRFTMPGDPRPHRELKIPNTPDLPNAFQIIEIFFATTDGYEDIHVYLFRARDSHFRRMDPTCLSLHGRDDE